MTMMMIIATPITMIATMIRETMITMLVMICFFMNKKEEPREGG